MSFDKSFDTLPLELTYTIVTWDPIVWKNSVLSIPFVYRTFSCEMERIKAKFSEVKREKIEKGRERTTFLLCGRPHREGDRPAIITRGDSYLLKEWYVNGLRHREEKAAIFKKKGRNSSYLYYKRGRLHREGDLPALSIKTDEGKKYSWYFEDKLHRENGPAITFTSRSLPKYSYEDWYKHGKKHRDGDLPAVYIKDASIVKKIWYVEGRKHRDNGPAFMEEDRVAKFFKDKWYVDGELHREDGPAVVERLGKKVLKEKWLDHGIKHRENGPAETTWDIEGNVKDMFLWVGGEYVGRQ